MWCPFLMCGADIEPVTHRTDPYDETATVLVMPIHDVVGIGSWFGRCPASHLIVPGLTERGKLELRKAFSSYMRQLLKRRPELGIPKGEAGSPITGDGRLGGQIYPEPPHITDYFPGRPADAPEPGTGEGAASPIPPTVSVTPLGRAGDMSDARTEMRAHLAKAKQGAGEMQELTAILTNHLDDIAPVLKRLSDKHEETVTALRAAVGSMSEAGGVSAAQLATAVSALARIAHAIDDAKNTAMVLWSFKEDIFAGAGETAESIALYEGQV